MYEVETLSLFLRNSSLVAFAEEDFSPFALYANLNQDVEELLLIQESVDQLLVEMEQCQKKIDSVKQELSAFTVCPVCGSSLDEEHSLC